MIKTIVKYALSRKDRVVPEWVKTLARFRFLVERGDLWHFAAVYVETVQQCNRRCSYCPQSISPMPKAFMTAEDFNIARSRLFEHHWCGPVYLSRFGEPLLDPFIVERVRAMRDITPHVQLFSNGDRLTDDIATDLVRSGLEVCKLTRHNPVKEGWDERISGILARYPDNFVLLDAVNPYTIGGLNPEAKAWSKCTLPSWAFIINPNLDVSLCCHDYNRDHVFGNLRDESIKQIWNKPRFVEVRRNLRAGKPAYEICRACFGDDEAKSNIRTRMANLRVRNVDRELSGGVGTVE